MCAVKGIIQRATNTWCEVIQRNQSNNKVLITNFLGGQLQVMRV